MVQVLIGKQFPQQVIPLIEAAKRSLSIVVFDWRWYPQDPGAAVQLFNQAIVRAVRRGVEVRAIANNDEIIKTLKSVGVKASKMTSTHLLHSKLMVIDGRVSITGSHNYTQHAFTQNIELSVVIDSEEVAAEMLEFFNNLYKI